ncbi:---NA---, partial [Paramuricea clavata]
CARAKENGSGPCRVHAVGQVSLPPEGNTFVVLPGENVTIVWKLDVDVALITGRSWTFLPKGIDTFAAIIGDGGVVGNPQYSPGPFTIIKPATLILKNVTTQYNGTYNFFVSTLRGGENSIVTVFVAGKCMLYNIL